MKAIVITKGGGPEVLELQDISLNKPKAREVRIKIKAAGVNRSDILTRKKPDAYGGDTPNATIPGLEVSGEVEQVGEGVSQYTVGDRVCALVAGGGYAEAINVDERLCLPIPKDLTYTEAASLPEVIFTVWFNIFQQAKATKGEGLLIHGGTSGIGMMGLQIAKALGLETFTTVGSETKAKFLEDRQLAKVVRYKEQDFEEIFKDEKIDVILDMVGGSYTQKNLNLLQPKGRLVYINGMESLKPQINLWTIMSKQLLLTGSLLKPQSVETKYKIAQEVQETVWPLLENGSVKTVIDKTFSLGNAAEAHKLMESSKHIGKIVLTIPS